uniref:Putative retrotransposon protein n=1 Tax=Phyllostachys edulis TaxID=38705 RepID=D3IVE4_PHYED|nr:putative retrotransposon protein [Phyllostachys edulis]
MRPRRMMTSTTTCSSILTMSQLTSAMMHRFAGTVAGRGATQSGSDERYALSQGLPCHAQGPLLQDVIAALTAQVDDALIELGSQGVLDLRWDGRHAYPNGNGAIGCKHCTSPHDHSRQWPPRFCCNVVPLLLHFLHYIMGDNAKTRDGPFSLLYLVLTTDNYLVWAMKMKANMRAQGVWGVVDPKAKDKEVDNKVDHTALAIIYQAVPDSMMRQLISKETAREVWVTLQKMHEGVDRVKEVRLQNLHTEFENLQMGETQSVDEFVGKLSSLYNQIVSLGDKIEESVAVKKYLRVLLENFVPVVTTLIYSPDLEEKKIEEITGSLKAHEELLKGYQSRNEQSLEEPEWNLDISQGHGGTQKCHTVGVGGVASGVSGGDPDGVQQGV